MEENKIMKKKKYFFRFWNICMFSSFQIIKIHRVVSYIRRRMRQKIMFKNVCVLCFIKISFKYWSLFYYIWLSEIGYQLFSVFGTNDEWLWIIFLWIWINRKLKYACRKQNILLSSRVPHRKSFYKLNKLA